MNEDQYLQKVYSGLLGKVIGVVLGAPLENPFWTYETIKDAFGEINSYVRKYKQFGADDDINGTLFFIRVVEDIFKSKGKITSQDIGKTWLNYISRNRGMIWWGGYGKSTEHTAYENILVGIESPISGSIAKNGKPLAEQIGGQIFVDAWGLLFPNEPEKSSYYAEIASRVSHDGEGVEGAKFISAMVSSAFSTNSVEETFITGLSYVKKDSEYFAMLTDIYDFYKRNPKNWRDAIEFLLKSKYLDNSKYPGPVHIIPNAGIIAISLLYGKGDFSKSVTIAVMCGMDTDCNAGNVGSILGVFNGPEKIPSSWKEQINDIALCSSSLGSLNIVDIPSFSKYLVSLNHIIHKKVATKEKINSSENILDFELPGSTHGFRTNQSGNILIKNVQDPYDYNNRCLEFISSGIKGYEKIELYRQFFYINSDLEDEKYGPMFSPTVYSGQEVSCRIRACNIPKGTQLIAYMFAKTTNGRDLTTTDKVHLNDCEWHFLNYKIPDSYGEAISIVGIRIYIQGKNKYEGPLYLDDFKISGKTDYYIDFSKQPEEFGSLRQFSFNQGAWRKIDGFLDGTCSDFGSIYTGNYSWKNYELTTTITPIYNKEFGIVFRCKGNLNYYLLKFYQGNISLEKHSYEGRIILTNSFSYPISLNKDYQIKILVINEKLCAWINQQKIFEIKDENPIDSGCVGYQIFNGSRISVKNFALKEV